MRSKFFAIILTVFILISTFSSCEKNVDENVENNVPETSATNTAPEISVNIRDTSDSADAVMLPEQEVRVISMNLYQASSLDGRGEVMTELLLSYDADSIGVQETYGWVNTLDEGLVGYARAGYTSDLAPSVKSYTGANYIYYKADKYNVIDSGIFWLTGAPENISHYRTCSWVILENKETGFRYVHMNTHLEYNDEVMNAKGAAIVRDMMRRFIELGFPVFTTGDFNNSEGSENYLIMMDYDGLNDSKMVAKKSMSMGTYHGFSNRDLTGGRPIDYCFVSHECMTVRKYEVIDTRVNGKYASDHCGIFVHAKVHSLPDQYELIPNISFSELDITVNDVRPYVADFTFPQITDCFGIYAYNISAVPSDGSETVLRDIPAKLSHDNPPEEVNCTLSALTPGTEYTVTITPVTVIGTYNTSVTFTFTTPELD